MSEPILMTNEDQAAALSALHSVMMSSSEGRKALGKQSPQFYCKYYLDLALADHQLRWVTETERRRRALILGPCGHGKTETFSKVLQLRTICRNRDVRILLVSASDKLAVKNLKVIKYHLEYNQRIIQDFGRFFDKTLTWTDHQMYVQRPKRDMKDATVEAVGLLGAITGGRFDIIILDDVIDANNSHTEAGRRRIHDYIKGTLVPRLEPWGVVWAIGTRKHYDDFYGHGIINDPTWYVIHDKAIIREPDDYKVVERKDPIELMGPDGTTYDTNIDIQINGDDRGEVLWPEKWDIVSLLIAKHSLGHLFTREYQNIAASNERALFKIEDLKGCCDETLSYWSGDMLNRDDRLEYDVIIQGVDPSLVDDKRKAEAEDTDYAVIWTSGVKSNGEEVLLGLERRRGMQPSEILQWIEDEYERFNPAFCFVEVNSFGIIHANSLIRDKGLRVVKHYTDRKKSDLYVGVPAMAIKFENRKIRLPYKTAADKKKTDRLIVEFHYLGQEAHDDIVMGGWITMCGIDRWKKGVARERRNVGRTKNVRRSKTKRQSIRRRRPTKEIG